MNETRDRLRKKLSQLISARKNMKVTEEDDKALPIPSGSKQPISLKSAAKAASLSSVAANVQTDDDSLECLNTLCKRISHLHTTKTGATKKQPTPTAAAPASAPAPHSPPAATNTGKKTPDSTVIDTNAAAAATKAAVGKRPCLGKIVVDGETGMDVVSEIYEFLDNYSKDQTKVNKWIKDTLSYIEGSDNSGGKKQPQTSNPKKAAKKAKQKQRKEEEKRIDELQVLRCQFSDIYFKEFTEKQELKSFKTSKKRDKKRINELEVNIKKLQRAKAKVESEILELIATVKQTNNEFKFSYLPTKEQQLEKIKELNATAGGEANSVAAATVSASRLSRADESCHNGSNNFINFSSVPAGGGAYKLPYGHSPSHFPYHIDFQASQQSLPNSTAYGMIRPPLPNPMCYAPPQHQQLSPDVVAAMAANAAACSANTDPSKRIVTIRRVNLPNVADPQVTVTARGSSPDKDKLLYTFVNGQLVQQGAAAAGGAIYKMQLPKSNTAEVSQRSSAVASPVIFFDE